jgi:hypothetical protein
MVGLNITQHLQHSVRCLLAAGLALSLALLGAPARPVVADTGFQVVYGRPAEAQISDADAQQTWDFAPNAKDRITITVERTSGTLVPRVELHNDSNQIIAKADQDTTYARASIINFTIPAPGHYTVVVSRYNGVAGKTIGKYRLIVSLLGLGEDGFNPTFVEAELQLGHLRDGTLSEARWRDTWAFRTQDTQPITVLASRIRGTLVPVIELFDSHWKSVAKGQLDDSFTTAFIVNFVPTASTEYYIVISRIGGTTGGTTGDYRLIVAHGQPPS